NLCRLAHDIPILDVAALDFSVGPMTPPPPVIAIVAITMRRERRAFLLALRRQSALHAGASDAPHRLLYRREGLADDAGCDPGIAAIEEAEIVNRVEIVQRRLVAAHQRRLLADCRRPQPRADAPRVRAGVERDAEHRR